MTAPRVPLRRAPDPPTDLEREYEEQQRAALVPDGLSDLEHEFEAMEQRRRARELRAPGDQGGNVDLRARPQPTAQRPLPQVRSDVPPAAVARDATSVRPPINARPPATFRDSVTAITGKPTLGVHDVPGAVLKALTLGQDATGIYHPALDHVSLKAGQGEGGNDRVFAHEMGHRLDSNLFGDPKARAAFDSATTLPTAQKPTGYAATNRDEHFAEAFSNAVDLVRRMGGKLPPSPEQSHNRELAMIEMDEAERRVPGTAVLVRHILDNPVYADHWMQAVRGDGGPKRKRAPVAPSIAAARDATAAPLDARETYRPNVLERTALAAGGMVADAKKDPAGTALHVAKSLVVDPAASLLKTTGGALERGFTDAGGDPDRRAISDADYTNANAQTIANTAFLPGEGAIARELTKRGVSKTGALLAGSAAAGAPIGAAYDPDDPARGALLGGLLSPVIVGGGVVAARGAGVARRAGQAVARDTRAALTTLEGRRAARRKAGGEAAGLTDAQLDAPPTLAEVESAIADLSAEHASATEPTHRAELDARLTGLESMRRKLSGEPDPEMATAAASRRAKDAGVRSVDDLRPSPIAAKLAELKRRVAGGEEPPPPNGAEPAPEPVSSYEKAERAAEAAEWAQRFERDSKTAKRNKFKNAIDAESMEALLAGDEAALERHLAEAHGADSKKLLGVLSAQQSQLTMYGVLRRPDLYGTIERAIGRVHAIHGADHSIYPNVSSETRKGWDAAEREMRPSGNAGSVRDAKNAETQNRATFPISADDLVAHAESKRLPIAETVAQLRKDGYTIADDVVAEAASRPVSIESRRPPQTADDVRERFGETFDDQRDRMRAAVPAHESLARFGETMYHETSLERAVRLLDESIMEQPNPLYLANTRELALGQGKNKGVHIEFDAAALRGAPNTAKPGLAFTAQQGAGEFIGDNAQGDYHAAVRSITLAPDMKLYGGGPWVTRARRVLLPQLERQGWTKETLADGSTRYTRPGAEAPPVPQARPEAPTRPAPERSIKVADEDGTLRHVSARTPSGGRRPVETVTTEGLLQELIDLEKRRADAESRAVYRVEQDPNFHTSGIPQIVSTKPKGGGPSMQAKAGRNLEDFARATDEIHAALEARGLTLEDIFDRTEDLRVRLDERAGLAGEYDATRLRRDVLVDETTGEPLFDPAPSDEPMFSPGDRDLFGNDVPEKGSGQGSMFGEREGTAASRSLRETEAAARAELDQLTTAQRLETDPAAAQARASRIAELQRLVNRGEKITPDELATRTKAEQETPKPSGPDQAALFSPINDLTSKVGGALRRITGQKPPVAQAVRIKSLRSISEALADGVGVPLREGRFRAGQRKALGVFFPHAEVARLTRMDRITTAAHEIGHYVSKHHLRNPTMKGAAGRGAQSLSMAAKRELVKMGRDLYGSRKPAGGYGEEGIAQWARFYVTEHARLANDAPNFSAWMDGVLKQEPVLQQTLDAARQAFEDHAAAPPTARVDAMMSVNDQSALASGLRNINTPDKRSWLARKIVSLSLDDLNEFKRAVAELGGADSPTKDAYVLARLTRGAAGIAEEMLERGIVDPGTGQRVAPSVVKVLESLKPDELQPFRRYLVAERAIELAKRGVDAGIALDDARALVQMYEGQFKARAEQLWQVSAALIDYRVAKGLLTAAEGAAIKAGNQRRVGLFRVFEDTETGGKKGTGKGFGSNSSGMQRAKGSSREIIDPLESVITDVYKTTQQAHAHEAALALYKHAIETEGGGRVAELVPPPQLPVEIPLERIKAQLEELGLDTSGADLSGVLRSFQDATQAGAREVKDMVVPVILDGERKWLAIKDAQLYDAIKGLDQQQLPGWYRIVGAPTRMLRAGATLTGEFIARNPVRDAFTAAVFSQGPTRLPGHLAAEGLFHLAKRDDLFQRWKLAGGDNAAQLGLDRAQVQHDLKALTRSTHGKIADVVLHPIDALRMVSGVMENATRLGEFAAVERKGKAAGMARADVDASAAYASRDVTIDFAKAGHWGRHANQIMSFFNANTQGSAKLLSELRTRPTVVVPRIMAMVTMPSIALYLLQRNDPAYQEVPQWQKDVSWVIIDRDENGELQHIWRIPKPPELGILFGTTFERALQFIDTHDPQAIDGMAADLLDVVNPVHLPDGLRPAVEWWANKSAFRGRPIVPAGMEKLPPAEQSTRYTGESARQLGSLLDVSPAKIENTVTGYAGGLGRYAMEGADAVVRGVRSAANMAPLAGAEAHSGDPMTRTPVVRGFAIREPGNDAESVQRTYEDFREAESHRLAWRKKLAAGDQRGAAQYLNEHREAIASVMPAEDNGGLPGHLRSLYTQLTGLQLLSAQVAKGMRDPERLAETQRRIADKQVELARAYRGRRFRPQPSARELAPSDR